MNEALQALEIKVENGGATPQGKFFAKDWNTLVEAVKQLDLAEFDEAALNKYLKDKGYITSDDIPSTDLSDVVTRSGEQTIPGPKNFTGGLMVNGQPLIYNAELGVWELIGDLMVTGNVAWFASIKGFKPSTIMDAVQVDGETIVKNELGQLKAIGGGSGGSGGGLTVSDLSNYLTTNKYTKQSDVETLISTALTPYALTAAIPTNNNQLSNGAGYITAAALNDYAKTTDIPSLNGYATEQWVTNKGYITSSALNGYATQDWVTGKKYLTGITSSQVTTALGFTPYDSTNPDKYIKGINYDMVIAALGYTPYSTTNPMGYLTISSLLGYATEQWVGDNYLAKSGGSVSSDDYQPLIVNSNFSSGVEDVRIAISHNWNVKGLFNWESNGVGLRMYNTACGSAIGIKDDGTPYYDSYELIHSGNIGLSNAGSATKLATPRTIWGQSFDGTKDISGLLTNVDGIRGSTTDGGYIGDRNKGIGATDGGSMIYNYSASPITFHINGSERMRIGADGNATINGDLFAIGNITAYGYLDAKYITLSGVTALTNYRNEAVIFGTASKSSYIDGSAVYIRTGANSVNTFRFTPEGNFVIGGETADAKLHIHYNSGTTGIEITRSGVYECSIGFANSQGRYVTGYWGGAYHIWSGSTGTRISVRDDSATINGDLLVNGNVSWISQSQRSLKNIISEQGLSLAQLERIKPIKFYWKDGRDAALHVGGVADVFDEVLPEVVARNKGVLCLNYVDAAFYVGASLIAPVLDHERRITEGEQEREALKRENAILKRELAIMKQMLNQLPA